MGYRSAITQRNEELDVLSHLGKVVGPDLRFLVSYTIPLSFIRATQKNFWTGTTICVAVEGGVGNQELDRDKKRFTHNSNEFVQHLEGRVANPPYVLRFL